MSDTEIRLEIAKMAHIKNVENDLAETYNMSGFERRFEMIYSKVFPKVAEPAASEKKGADMALVFETVGLTETIALLEKLEATTLQIQGAVQDRMVTITLDDGESLTAYLRKKIRDEERRRKS